MFISDSDFSAYLYSMDISDSDVSSYLHSIDTLDSDVSAYSQPMVIADSMIFSNYQTKSNHLNDFLIRVLKIMMQPFFRGWADLQCYAIEAMSNGSCPLDIHTDNNFID